MLLRDVRLRKFCDCGVVMKSNLHDDGSTFFKRTRTFVWM